MSDSTRASDPDQEPSGTESGPDAETPSSVSGTKRWRPDASAETAAVLRRLAANPWLLAGRDDDDLGTVRRNLPAIRATLVRLGWVLIVERDFVRLQKSPPARRSAAAAEGPTPQQASWFFLMVAGCERVGERAELAQVVAAARAAAAEIGISTSDDIAERRAIVAALRMLEHRGALFPVDGDVDSFVEDGEAPVLLAVHHGRLLHAIARFGTADPVADPEGWLAQVEHEPDAARRMRRRLVDDTLVHVAGLDEAEQEWLSRRFRSDDGAPLALAFGLKLERRQEGAAFVVPADAFRHGHELGPTPYPAPGTVPHAALLLAEHAGAPESGSLNEGGPGPGWLGLPEAEVHRTLEQLAAARADGRGGWRRELAEDPRRLARDVRALLCSLDLLRIQEGADAATPWWWFSPANGRWDAVQRDVGGPAGGGPIDCSARSREGESLP